MSGKSHIDIAALVHISVFHNYTKAVWYDAECERVLAKILLDLRVVFHSQRQENDVLSLIPVRDAVQFWDLAVAYLASCRPKGQDDNLSLQLTKTVILTVQGLSNELGSLRTRPQLLLSSHGGSQENCNYEG